ncbi:Grx4 family monothiol glutaredoxin [Candidatus Blochmannia ocreatus (nom. nud.)]|uniref:Glutaredoxin n=1 Tax=Candidatus Blochmannia ocreatus (nom. nud.) TaxID=251538 RepID=A0ABY4SSB1_9ENTR|nr:Grx4 family monothiol glutaredoxin [Candidatus Blochmannia ocreatus]URJ24875.1 Grx4 family monothiol glutaredoxin [Candidatus Blochmannia ocreatus]
MKDTIKKIEDQIKKHPVTLYMKGTPETPKCGFSAKAAQILSIYTKNFFYIDVLSYPDIRSTLPIFSNWPTFPQLWIKEKLIGGVDIMLELHNSGKLKILINSATL